MKFTITLLLCTALAFTAGWVLSRSATLKQYPPETVEYITELRGYLDPMSKEEMAEAAYTMQKNLNIIRTEFDYQALYEGMSARYFQLALEKGGESETKELVDTQLRKFQDRYDRGLSLPEGSMKLATTLNETIQKTNSEQAGTGQPATRSVLESEGSDKPQPESEGRSR